MPESIKPNFAVVGAAKSATTSIYNYLGQHPDICLSRIKEPHYFSQKFKRLPFMGPKDDSLGSSLLRQMTYEEYLELFSHCAGYQMIGDCSADYLYYHQSAAAIRDALGDIKIIACLRNPITRAYSAYMHMLRDGREWREFSDALALEHTRKGNNWDFMWHYATVGLYYEQVKSFLDTFSNVKVMIYDDLKQRPDAFLQDLCYFLDVRADWQFDVTQRHNTNSPPKNRKLRKFLVRHPLAKSILRPILPRAGRRWLKSRFMPEDSGYTEMPSKGRLFLKEYFREDVNNLQLLIGRDLSFWLD